MSETQIREALGKLDITITPKMITQFLDIVASWENKRNNPLVLHGQLIGVYRIFFLPQDRAELFHLVGLEEKDLVEVIKGIPNIVKTRNVESDPFNILSVWLIHLADIQVKNKKSKDLFKLAVAKYLHYKFFTSLIGNSFPHGADEGVMTATIFDLSAKYDIVRYGSWFKTIEARSEDMISDHSIHKKTFLTAAPDRKYCYIMSDTQSRIRDKVKLIARAYYDHHASGKSVGSMGATMTDAEGEKRLIERSSTIQNAENRIIRDLLNSKAWVHPGDVRAVASQFTTISQKLIEVGVTQMSAIATLQSKSKPAKDTETIDGVHVVVNMVYLVRLIITASAAICTQQGVVLKNTAQAWRTLKNAFSSSRTLDPDVLLVKASVAKFVNDLGASSRPATMISLRMGIIMYVVYKFIKLMKRL